MKRLLIASLTLSVLLPSVAAFARTYDASHLPYSDAPEELATAVAVSVLTDEGILFGDPGGTIRPDDLLNRAEFITIAMRFMPTDGVDRGTCFSDVPANAWYAKDVCRAKAYGIVEGNADPAIPKAQWRFAPTRPVNYAEALKILTHVFAVPTISRANEEWYLRFLRAAHERELGFASLTPSTLITRGEMARIAVDFFAFSQNELSLLREAQGLPAPTGGSSSSSPSSQSSSSSSSSSSVSLQSSSSSSSSSAVISDPEEDVSNHSQHVLLGSTTPILAAAKIFPDTEPLLVHQITIELLNGVQSVDSFFVYGEDQAFLGYARRDSSSQYVLRLGNDDLLVGRREEYSFYVRARLKEFTSGGTSGEDIQVETLSVSGDGGWSMRPYTQSTTETFPVFETARSVIRSIANAGGLNEPLVPGTGQEIGRFLLSGETGDGSADVRLTDLVFLIEQFAVTLTNVELLADGSNKRHTCVISANTITCSGLPAAFGTLEDAPRTLRLYGDIAIGTGVSKASLRITLNQPGSITTSGAVTWTDGTTTFTWLGMTAPLARGTYYEY